MNNSTYKPKRLTNLYIPNHDVDTKMLNMPDYNLEKLIGGAARRD